MSNTAFPSEKVNIGTTTSWIPLITPGPSPNIICSSMLSLGPFHCPSDYSTTTTSAMDAVSTLTKCCLSGYDFKGLNLAQNCVSTRTAGAVMAKIVYAPSGNWISWDDITLSTAGVSVIGIQVLGYMFNSPTPAPTINTQVESGITSGTAGGVTNAAEASPLSAAALSLQNTAAQSQSSFYSSSSSSEARKTKDTSTALHGISSPAIPSSLTDMIATCLPGTMTAILFTLPATSSLSSSSSGTTTFENQSAASSQAHGISLCAKISTGIGAAALAVATGTLIALLHMLHRRNYINERHATKGEEGVMTKSGGKGPAVTSGGIRLIRGGGSKGFWIRRTNRTDIELGDSSGQQHFRGVKELSPRSGFQDVLLPLFVEELHEAPASSLDEGPHEVDGTTGRSFRPVDNR